ncbi:phosphate transport system regulatory protein PhoU [Bacillus sp. AFS076308]|uniref:phosphate signaling complex protein PhoU n=1 Tax=unclassified Bacillus (in: firmicutes) TaxID=185979 RepID=UPI000BF91297|nr:MULTISPECIES: phosphate signaling complex protein PhoU [unclassified Bacillus (in: firmicutes)]PFO01419.1 phosphate transport system regulatory protein PhoU [Bacillus sp. AFS076308]PGV52261.1 phosphate transport system regulatory protein PhoU [Bacillus sp. AFS037270]
MNTRFNFDSNLKQLKDMLIEMARKSENAIKESIDTLINQDIEKAKEIINNDTIIDELEHEINNKAIILIAKESPVARDLRKIIVALKISSEVERIADNAVNIAKSTLHIGKEKHIKEIVDIPKMMDLALEMLSDSLKAFLTEDVELARKCAEKDDKVDEMYGRLIKELMDYIQKYPSQTNQITQLAFVCRYIERLGDHSTNIAEHVIYLVTGQRLDLNA